MHVLPSYFFKYFLFLFLHHFLLSFCLKKLCAVHKAQKKKWKLQQLLLYYNEVFAVIKISSSIFYWYLWVAPMRYCRFNGSFLIYIMLFLPYNIKIYIIVVHIQHHHHLMFWTKKYFWLLSLLLHILYIYTLAFFHTFSLLTLSLYCHVIFVFYFSFSKRSKNR